MSVSQFHYFVHWICISQFKFLKCESPLFTDTADQIQNFKLNKVGKLSWYFCVHSVLNGFIINEGLISFLKSLAEI